MIKSCWCLCRSVKRNVNDFSWATQSNKKPHAFAWGSFVCYRFVLRNSGLCVSVSPNAIARCSGESLANMAATFPTGSAALRNIGFHVDISFVTSAGFITPSVRFGETNPRILDCAFMIALSHAISNTTSLPHALHKASNDVGMFTSHLAVAMILSPFLMFASIIMFVPLMWIVQPTCKRAASCDAFMLGFTMSNSIRPMWAGSSNMPKPANIMTHTMWIVKQNVSRSNHDNVTPRGLDISRGLCFPLALCPVVYVGPLAGAGHPRCGYGSDTGWLYILTPQTLLAYYFRIDDAAKHDPTAERGHQQRPQRVIL